MRMLQHSPTQKGQAIIQAIILHKRTWQVSTWDDPENYPIDLTRYKILGYQTFFRTE
jgi:hypothetical protein